MRRRNYNEQTQLDQDQQEKLQNLQTEIDQIDSLIANKLQGDMKLLQAVKKKKEIDYQRILNPIPESIMRDKETSKLFADAK